MGEIGICGSGRASNNNERLHKQSSSDNVRDHVTICPLTFKYFGMLRRHSVVDSIDVAHNNGIGSYMVFGSGAAQLTKYRLCIYWERSPIMPDRSLLALEQ